MNRSTLIKFVQFALILVIGVAADQWTKWYAEERLAITRPGQFAHEIVLRVPAALDGKTARDVLNQEFTWSTPEELDRIGKTYLRAEDDRRIRGDEVVKAGDAIRVTYRDVTIIDGYWDFQYARNPGAAFSFLADADPAVRRPFFIAMSVLALLAILYILMGVQLNQQLLIWGLSLIASGAVGNNLIDRVRFGYVIDFILWKYTDAYRWPVFNIADVLICVGVGLMVIDMIRDTLRQRALDRASDAPEDVASSEQAANPSA